MKLKMIKLIFFIIGSFCIILTSCAIKPIQRDLEGFLGITWEENVSNALSILSENNFRIMYSDDRGIGAEGIFLDEEVILDLLFSNDRFYIVGISINNKSNSLERYYKLIDLLIERYGKPTLILREHPEITMKMTTWHFRNSSTISISFDPELNFINFTYTNNRILNEKK